MRDRVQETSWLVNQVSKRMLLLPSHSLSLSQGKRAVVKLCSCAKSNELAKGHRLVLISCSLPA